MKISDCFQAKYLKAEDLLPGITTALIVSISQEDVGGKGNATDMKPVIYLEGIEQGLAVIQTNALVLAEAYGDETDNWLGLPLSMQRQKVQYMGKMVDGIRIVPGTKEMAAAMKAQQKALKDAQAEEALEETAAAK